MATKDKNVICSFCGKTSQEAERIVLGPGVNICNECIMLCADLLEEDGIIQTKSNTPKHRKSAKDDLNVNILTPAEIKTIAIYHQSSSLLKADLNLLIRIR